MGTTEALLSNMDKASLLTDVFSKNFSNSVPPLSEFDCHWFIADPSPPLPEDILCTEQELFHFDTNKVSGPDGISGKMFEWTASYLYHTNPNRAFQSINHKWENICFTHGMQMHSVSTTSGLITGMPSHFSPHHHRVCGLGIGCFTQTASTAKALVTLLEKNYQWTDLSLTPASPVQCCVDKFYSYIVVL